MRRLSVFLFTALVVAILVPMGSVARAKTFDVAPITGAQQAKQVCMRTCKAAGGTWDGNWTEVKGRNPSTCSCDMPPPRKQPNRINAKTGPITDEGQAKEICPRLCKSKERVWKGEWEKAAQGRGATCACYLK